MKKKGKRRRRRKNDISLLSNAPFPFASGLGRLSSLFSLRPRKRRRRSREGQSLLRTSRPAIERIRRQLHRRWRRATSLSFLDLSSVYRRLNSPLDPAQLAKRQGGTRFKCLDAKRERSGGEPRCDSCRGRASENEKMKGKKLETHFFLVSEGKKLNAFDRLRSHGALFRISAFDPALVRASAESAPQLRREKKGREGKGEESLDDRSDGIPLKISPTPTSHPPHLSPQASSPKNNNRPPNHPTPPPPPPA